MFEFCVHSCCHAGGDASAVSLEPVVRESDATTLAPSEVGDVGGSSGVPMPVCVEEQLRGMKLKELQQLLREQWWPVSGSKEKLVRRIMELKDLQQAFDTTLSSLSDAAAADASLTSLRGEGGLPALQPSMTQNIIKASKRRRACFISRTLYTKICMI